MQIRLVKFAFIWTDGWGGLKKREAAEFPLYKYVSTRQHIMRFFFLKCTKIATFSNVSV